MFKHRFKRAKLRFFKSVVTKSTYESTYEYIRVTYEYMRVTYEYIRVTYEYIRITYESHTSHIRVTYEYIRVTYEYIRVTYESHTFTISNFIGNLISRIVNNGFFARIYISRLWKDKNVGESLTSQIWALLLQFPLISSSRIWDKHFFP